MLPGTDLSVAPLFLGTGSFGTWMGAGESVEVLEAYLRLGGNVIDTANVYGRWAAVSRPASEELLGDWFRTHKGARQEVVLASKGGCPGPASMHILRSSRAEIHGDCDDSLRNLGTDFIDLYWLHHDDPARPVEDLLLTCEALVDAGKIRYYGCSNWRAARIWEALEAAKQLGLRGFVANQAMLNLASPNAEALAKQRMIAVDRDLHRLHSRLRLPLMAYSPQANGIFSAPSFASLTADDKYRSAAALFVNECTRWRYQAVRESASSHDITPTQMNLRFVLTRPYPTYPIVGPGSVAELKESIGALESEFKDDHLWSVIEGDGSADGARA
jgi:aryl-alcohol dehydrogenase-like predicted oxidoreductase